MSQEKIYIIVRFKHKCCLKNLFAYNIIQIKMNPMDRFDLDSVGGEYIMWSQDFLEFGLDSSVTICAQYEMDRRERAAILVPLVKTVFYSNLMRILNVYACV